MKIRIEIEGKDLKSSHEFESQNMDGEVLRDKIIGFLSASGVFEGDEGHAGAAHAGAPRGHEGSGTLMDKLESFIRFEFSNTWFTTQELREKYETVADDIKLSTVSTYLSRMNRDGLLERRGNRNNRHYRLIAQIDQEIAHHQSSNDRKRAESRW